MSTVYSGLVEKVFKSGCVLIKVAGSTYTVRSAIPVSSLKEKTIVSLSKDVSGNYFILGKA